MDTTAMIKADKVVVFSKEYCPFCVRVKKLLEKHTEFKAYELDQMKNGNLIQQEVSKISRIRTVPQVFIHGKPYGGCDAITALERSGELQKILKE